MIKLTTKETQYITRWAKILKGIEYLGGKCLKCGETDPILLDFHHKDQTNKVNEVSKILGAWVFSECKQELDRCVLLCTKCHRKEHFDYERFNNNLQYIKNRMGIIENIGSKKKLYESKKQDVINMINNGESFRDIYRKTNMSRNAIKRLATMCNVNRSEFTNRIDIDENIFINMYNNNATYDEICNFFNISKFPFHRVRKKLLDQGKIKRRKGCPKKIERILIN